MIGKFVETVIKHQPIGKVSKLGFTVNRIPFADLPHWLEIVVVYKQTSRDNRFGEDWPILLAIVVNDANGLPCGRIPEG